MKLEELRKKQKELAGLLWERLDREALRENIVFSYLGARICYAESHPLKLFEEEKFKDPDKFRSFLMHLKRAGHFSVFAHTPILINTEGLSVEEKFLLASTFFKVFWNDDGNLALFNLRHLAETLEEREFFQLLSVEPALEEIEVLVAKNYQTLYRGSLKEIPPELLQESESLFAEPEIIILRSYRAFPFGWIGVLAHNYSRIFSHQFVRHTWLNFNQRSHRYTKVDRFVVPGAFKEKERMLYEELISKGLQVYQELCRNIKKESARFVVPQGVATTVLATGPHLVWQDFVQKRAIPQAQEEIRDLAKFLNEALLS